MVRLRDILTPLEATGKVVYEDGSTNFDPEEEDWYPPSSVSENEDASEVTDGNEDWYDGEQDEQDDE